MSERTWRDRALVQLTLLRFREFVREPEALFWTLAFPVLISVGLGIAFRNQPADVVRIAVVAPDLAKTITADKRILAEDMSPAAAIDALRTGKVLLVAEPAPSGGVIYRYDDTNPEARQARMIVDDVVQDTAGRADPIAATDDVSREAGSRYIDFLVPGLVGMGVMSNAVWGLGFSIVDARRRKLMKRIVATPMPRRDFLLSYLLWRKILLVVEVGVPVVFGVVAFGVPVRGSIVELILLAVLGSLAFSALGVLIASRARTIEAVSGLMNLVMVPMWILSGVFFSSSRFPDVMQPLIKVLPLTALNDAMRANMLQGASLVTLWPQVAALAGCVVVCFSLAMRLFRWK